MAQDLADILVTLTLDTSKFKQQLQDVARDLENFSNDVSRVTTQLNGDFTNNMDQIVDNLQDLGDTTQDVSDSIADNLDSINDPMQDVIRSSRRLSRTAGTDLADMQRVLESATAEYEQFGSTGRRVSRQVSEQFAYLPRHLQRYVERLQEAGQSTAEFSQLNEMYGQRNVESMRRTNDYLQNSTMDSTRIISSLRDLNIQPLSQQFLRLGQRLEDTARRGSALNVALAMVGPNASAKQLSEQMKLINKGIGRARMTLIAFGIATALAVYGLVKMSNIVDGRLIPAFDELKSVWLDALTPFIRAFTTFVVWVMSGATAIGKLMKSFAELHPQLSQMLWGFLLLTLALTALLSPLAIGIGLGYGMSVMFGVLWKMIAPFVLGFLTVAGVSVLVAGAIVTVVAVLNNLWENSKKFANAWTNLWNGIKKAVVDNFAKPITESWNNLKKSFGQLILAITGEGTEMANLWTWLGDHIATVVNFLAKGIIPVLTVAFKVLGFIVSGVINAIAWSIDKLSDSMETIKRIPSIIVDAFKSGDFSEVTSLFTGLFTSIVNALTQGGAGLLTTGSKMLQSLLDGMGLTLPELLQLPFNIMASFLGSFAEQLPQIIKMGGELLNSLSTGLLVALPSIMMALVTIVQSIVSMITTYITEYLPMIIQIGLTILTAIIQGITENLPIILQAVISIITALLETLILYLPSIIEAGLTLLMALITGIVSAIPLLLPVIYELVSQIVEFILVNLPLILDAGIQILMALIEGIVEILPLLITTAIDLVLKIVEILLDNLPMLIDAGIQILLAIIDGIIDILPELIVAAILLITEICDAIIENLPTIIDAGIEILMALIDGLIEAIPELVGAIPQIVGAIFDAFAEVDWMSIGKDIMGGIGKGITNAKDALFGSVKSIAKGLLSKAKETLDINSPSKEFANQVGKWIPYGIADGITQAGKVPVKAVGEVSDDVLGNNGFKGRSLTVPSLDHSKGTSDSGTTTNNVQYVINATVREDADVTKIVDEIEKRKRIEQRSKGVFAFA